MFSINHLKIDKEKIPNFNQFHSATNQGLLQQKRIEALCSKIKMPINLDCLQSGELPQLLT